MAVVSRSSNTWILSLKVLLISTCVVFMALILKFSVPLILEFAVSEAPVMWSSVRSWLRPPYLYFIINGIIITIAASSRFHHKNDELSETLAPAKVPPDVRSDFSVTARSESGFETEIRPEFDVMESPAAVYEKSGDRVWELKTVTSALEADDEDDVVISRSTWTPPQRSDSSEYLFPTEKSPVSARFGHRKTVKSSPEGGKALRVLKPKREETLESAWKTITEGRAMPLTRHLRKSDTWETHGRHNNPATLDQKVVKKSETFKDLTTNNPPSSLEKVKKAETFKDHTNNNQPSSLTSSLGSRKLRKEASPSQDELNRRVEAFINKFNEEMRLQRQESLNQYWEMIGRGAT